MEDYGERVKLLELLADIQRNCGPIELGIGYVEDGTVHQGILLKRAPAVVVSRIVEAGYWVEVMPQGAKVIR